MELTAQRLRELTDYDPDTGRFIRRAGPKAGKPFRKPRGKKSVRIKIDGKTYRTAQCAFLRMTGEWPTRRVVRKDGNIKNDRWANLELEERPASITTRRKISGALRLTVIAAGSIPRRKRTLLTALHVPNAACKKN